MKMIINRRSPDREEIRVDKFTLLLNEELYEFEVDVEGFLEITKVGKESNTIVISPAYSNVIRIK